MVIIILYMFWSTTKGIISIGIRFLWVNLYRFRKAATQPQGLLAATMLLMLSLAGLSYSLTMSVAPDYSMFGGQKYVSVVDSKNLVSPAALLDYMSPLSPKLHIN